MPDLAHTRPATLSHLAHADAGTPQPIMHWDVFCRVIDNHGDLGVCWRLACHLAALGSAVRLWVDHATDLQWMAPNGHPGVQVLPWPSDNAQAWPSQAHPMCPLAWNRCQPHPLNAQVRQPQRQAPHCCMG
jgi:hypothetical protein